MELPIELLIGLGSVALALVAAAGYSHLTGNEASVDYDDDGTDEVTFGGDEPAQPSGAQIETSSTDPAYEEATASTDSVEMPLKEVREIGDNLTEITGIGNVRAEKFTEAGFRRAEDIWFASDSSLTDVEGIGSAAVSQIREEIGGIDYEGSSDDQQPTSDDAA